MGPGWKIEGTVTAAGDLEVRGAIEGEVRVGGCLHVAKDGRIAGKVRARHIRVEGEVEGELAAEEGIELLPGCRVHADLRARRLAVAEGASFRGAMDFEAPPAPGEREAAPAVATVHTDPETAPAPAQVAGDARVPGAAPAPEDLAAPPRIEEEPATAMKLAGEPPAQADRARAAPPALPPSALRFGPLPLRIGE